MNKCFSSSLSLNLSSENKHAAFLFSSYIYLIIN